MSRLADGAAGLGLHLSPTQIAQFHLYSRALLSWNNEVNLTAITEPEEVETKHFLDSLSVALVLGKGGRPPASLTPGLAVLDVGAGAGFPGIPLKIAYPEIDLALIESVHKKAKFLNYIVDALMLADVRVLAVRAEDLAHEARHRERYDVVVARAVAALPVLAELLMPFCTLGGMVVAQKKGDIAAELEEAQLAIEAVGGRVKEVTPVSLPGLEDGRMLVVIEKLLPTPGAYPRRAGVPQKHPLGISRGSRD